jgi:hypothetical protein
MTYHKLTAADFEYDPDEVRKTIEYLTEGIPRAKEKCHPDTRESLAPATASNLRRLHPELTRAEALREIRHWAEEAETPPPAPAE